MSHVVIVGSGIAGLTTALRLAGRHEVTLVTKDRLGDSNTALAQGGIAGVLSTEDSVESHIADTLGAGAGLCDEDAVRVLCTEGPERILELAATGVAFDRDEKGQWSRGLEGAHSIPRILHAGGDATGRAIIETLSSALRAQVSAGHVQLLEHTMLLDLVTTPGLVRAEDKDVGDSELNVGGESELNVGVEVEHSVGVDGELGLGIEGAEVTGIHVLRNGGSTHLGADVVVLATGGAGRLYAHTTNTVAATGDGLAAAIRAGVAVEDMEFYQFHPTALAGSGFLISEAVRGAGAVLLDADGHRFMPDIDRRGELAPRDIVALAIHRRTAEQGGVPCYLDARSVPEVAAHFPSITRGLTEHGFNLATDLIPVTPAAHYFMGGVTTDVDGRTSLRGLFVVGEAACTGVHGANRLASNSLLEGAVFGARAAAAITGDTGQEPETVRSPESTHAPESTPTSESNSTPKARAWTASPETSAISRDELQALAWAHLGVERNEQGLRSLLDHLREGERTLPRRRTVPSASAVPKQGTLAERIETANLALISRSLASHALARRESRGAHTRTDFPVPTIALLQETSSC